MHVAYQHRHNSRRVGSAREYGDNEGPLSPQLQKLLSERDAIVEKLRHPATGGRALEATGNADSKLPRSRSAAGTSLSAAGTNMPLAAHLPAADVQHVRMLRQTYLANGGTDTHFLQNLQVCGCVALLVCKSCADVDPTSAFSFKD